LQSVGFASPDDASVQQAIEANDTFIATLEAIHAAAKQEIVCTGPTYVAQHELRDR
jgi:hypothetical protein